MKFQTPCAVCGTITQERLCPPHMAEQNQRRQQQRDQDPARIAKKKILYSPAYRRVAKAIRQAGGVCHLCGKPEQPNDPWQVDHIDAGNPNSQLALAHRSCNASRGNKPITNN